MRRRLRTKSGRGGEKPTQMAWMTTAVILTAGLLWYVLHLFSTLSFGCEAVIAWWLEGGRFQPGLLQVTSLLVVSLAAWLYVDIVRPKPVRVPAGIRVSQVVLVSVMVVMSVLQWGFFRPQSEEGRIYAYFQDEVVGWPVVRYFFMQGGGAIEWIVAPPEQVVAGPFFDEFRTLETAYRREYRDPWIPRDYGRAGGRYDGRLECTARHEVDAAWERAYQAWLQAEQATEE
tara:strand:- start:5341 stop:6030 length:690 start_codon:yes stop_codon:yes gene_type:complete